MKIGQFKVKDIPVRFAYEGKDVWVHMSDMLKVEAGGKELVVFAADVVAAAKRRFPEHTTSCFQKLPILTKAGDVSKTYYWFYLIGTSFSLFGLNEENSKRIDLLVHKPIKAAL